MKAFPETFAIVDTETTGMRPGFARVMDIGIIRVEKGNVVEKYQTLVNSGQSVPGFISEFTGITDEDLLGAPPFDEVALEVERLLKDAVFVAHNAAFDYGFIKAEFARVGMEWDAETLCSVKLSRALFPKMKSHSLDSIIERYSIHCASRHRALPDAEAVWDFFKKLGRSVKPALLERAVRAVRSGVVSGVGRDTFSALPESAGVYMFYGPEQELLYIGKSKHVRTRARSHFSPAAMSENGGFRNDVTSVESIATPGELSALLLESAMIKSHSPIHNRMLRRKRILVVAKRARDLMGYDHVSFEKTGAISTESDVLAVFRTSAQGKNVLRSLAKEFRLCEKLLGLEESRGECFAYQLGNCDGACMGKVTASEHNARIQEAFKKRMIRSWPYAGAIIIKEETETGVGSVFFIDNWALVGAYSYEAGEYRVLIEGSVRFDYDTYKILARFLRKRGNQRSVQEVTHAEFKKMLAACAGEHETTIV